MCVRRANFGVKLLRPGSARQPSCLRHRERDGITAVAVRQALYATSRRQPPRRCGFGTRDRPHSLHQGR